MKCRCSKIINDEKIWIHLNKCELFKNLDRKSKIEFILHNSMFLTLSELKNIIIEHYVVQECSVTDLMKLFNLSRKRCELILEYFDISPRGARQAATQNRLEKTKQMSLLKYGVTNVSKLDSVKQQKIKTFREHYGVDNIYQSEEFKMQQRQKMIERYGVLSLPNRFKKKTIWWSQFSKEHRKQMTSKWRQGFTVWWNSLSLEDKDDHIKTRFKNTKINFTSSLEERIKRLLDILQISYVQQFFITRKSFDFLINDVTVLEINGDYWHANPLFYKNTDCVRKENNVFAETIWENDFNKIKIAESAGFNWTVIWEHDMTLMTDDELMVKLEKISKQCTPD